MIINHSSEILANRMARIEARHSENAMALIARYRGDMMTQKALERLDAPTPEPAPAASNRIDRRA